MEEDENNSSQNSSKNSSRNSLTKRASVEQNLTINQPNPQLLREDSINETPIGDLQNRDSNHRE